MIRPFTNVLPLDTPLVGWLALIALLCTPTLGFALAFMLARQIADQFLPSKPPYGDEP